MTRNAFLCFFMLILSSTLCAEYKNICPVKNDSYEDCINYLRESISLTSIFQKNLDKEYRAKIISFYLDSKVMPDKEYFIYAEISDKRNRRKSGLLFFEHDIDGFGNDIEGNRDAYFGKKIYFLVAEVVFWSKEDHGYWPDSDSGYYFWPGNEYYYNINFFHKILWSLKNTDDIKNLLEKLENVKEYNLVDIEPLPNNSKSSEAVGKIKNFIMEDDLKNKSILKQLGEPLPEKIEIVIVPFRSGQNTFAYIFQNTKIPCLRKIVVGADGNIIGSQKSPAGIFPLSETEVNTLKNKKTEEDENKYFGYLREKGLKIIIDRKELKK